MSLIKEIREDLDKAKKSVESAEKKARGAGDRRGADACQKEAERIGELQDTHFNDVTKDG